MTKNTDGLRPRGPNTYQKAPEGGRILEAMIKRRGTTRAEIVRTTPIHSSEFNAWIAQQHPISRTPRVMKAFSGVFGTTEEELWNYLTGAVSLNYYVPPHHRRNAVPQEWIDALFPIIGLTDPERVSRVLLALRNKVLSEQPDYEPPVEIDYRDDPDEEGDD